MSFSLDISKWVEAEKRDQDKAVRGATLQIFGTVATRTPVKTGALQNNWQYSLQNPADGTLLYDGPPGAAEASAITRARQESIGWKPGDVVWFVNNLPYAEGIESGRSDQAPQGMVDVTLREFDRAIKRNYG